MCQALRELMKDEIAKDIEQSREEGRKEGAIGEAVSIYRDDMGMDNQSIIQRIASKFNLTGEQAQLYVLGERLQP